eukprot:Plantae.Rhodophyta-Purpureofilum_apyrenoidigerum.ctg4997.p1 GENE.Plantae.Rhodophyta-Purpureofilum_apyrenoidigerum.ctg4997~~Plantae.Rhodophyta-Purpureofilum_apyrenoidigerum.ctg4997.p1  ORF type:complete len:335 (-),score=54.52 Plantae.Rhodophyta-Purpureofilum_apyrenoidigerum.ctg4997:123-1127(-)
MGRSMDGNAVGVTGCTTAPTGPQSGPMPAGILMKPSVTKRMHLAPEAKLSSRTDDASRPANKPVPSPPEKAFSNPNLAKHEAKKRLNFYHDLHEFMASIGQAIQRLPTLGFKELDLWVLYKEVTKRRGVDAVIAKKQWKEIADALNLPASCTDSGFRLRLHYVKYLEPFERAHFTPPPEIPSLATDTRIQKSAIYLDRKRKSASKPQTQFKSMSDNYSSSSSETLAMSPITSYESANVSSPMKKQRKGSPVTLDFSRLESNSLNRYRMRYRLQGSKKLSRQELVNAVTEHFRSSWLSLDNEERVLHDFVDCLRKNRATEVAAATHLTELKTSND